MWPRGSITSLTSFDAIPGMKKRVQENHTKNIAHTTNNQR
jgi:hypothetical protein